jgi:hypothetical protein
MKYDATSRSVTISSGVDRLLGVGGIRYALDGPKPLPVAAWTSTGD